MLQCCWLRSSGNSVYYGNGLSIVYGRHFLCKYISFCRLPCSSRATYDVLHAYLSFKVGHSILVWYGRNEFDFNTSSTLTGEDASNPSQNFARFLKACKSYVNRERRTVRVGSLAYPWRCTVGDNLTSHMWINTTNSNSLLRIISKFYRKQTRCKHGTRLVTNAIIYDMYTIMLTS